MAASAAIHACLEFLQPVLHTIFFPSHWLLSHITIVETTDSSERGTNPVTMTIIDPRKEYRPSWGSNQQPPILTSSLLPVELWGSVLDLDRNSISEVAGTLLLDLEHSREQDQECSLPLLCLSSL